MGCSQSIRLLSARRASRQPPAGQGRSSRRRANHSVSHATYGCRHETACTPNPFPTPLRGSSCASRAMRGRRPRSSSRWSRRSSSRCLLATLQVGIVFLAKSYLETGAEQRGAAGADEPGGHDLERGHDPDDAGAVSVGDLRAVQRAVQLLAADCPARAAAQHGDLAERAAAAVQRQRHAEKPDVLRHRFGRREHAADRDVSLAGLRRAAGTEFRLARQRDARCSPRPRFSGSSST